ncbi:MAG TPA: pyridoxal-phosphate dependent enzyme [Candidatus Limnocylindrales bacterium]|nr:pyridoxal-phosphate dependent enzyme [Candidatus Limnocylindrales bacterium]
MERHALDLPPAIAAMPRFDLTGGPSPLVEAPRLSAALGGGAAIWIKREDLLPLAFGGNKLRNLEFLVGEALARRADTLITSGRRWSNHCRLTAAAGARAGLGVHVVLTGPPVERAGVNERLDALLGATVHVAATDARGDREALVDEVAADVAAAGGRPYVIGVGGSSSSEGGAVGAVGQVVAGLELAAQANAAGIPIDMVVLPTGTGGTHAGILTGLRLAGLVTRVLGVAVTAPPLELRAVVAGLLEALAPLAGIDAPLDAIELDGDQLGGGYGVPTAAATEATALLARTEGIFVDPIYTAKALAGLVAGVREGRLGGTIVFWHAGGTPALFEATAPAQG